jgi:hypothetical protein
LSRVFRLPKEPGAGGEVGHVVVNGVQGVAEFGECLGLVGGE